MTMTKTDWSEEPDWRLLARPVQLDVASELKTAAAAGAHPVRIVRDWVDTRRAPGRLTLHEYLYYRLWDEECGHKDRASFVGVTAQGRFHNACVDARWKAMATDKLAFDLLMRGAGLPTPRIQAVTGVRRVPPKAERLDGPSETATWLRTRAEYPIFMKPVAMELSLGGMAADAYDPTNDTLTWSGGDPVPVTSAADRMNAQCGGYMVQSRLKPHPSLTTASGTVCSVRSVVLLGPQGPAMECAVMKVPGAASASDNYWRTGNWMARLDVHTGAAVRRVSGSGARLQINGPDVPGTPSGEGLAAPEWANLTDMVLHAARLLPGIRTQSWDVALTAEGPVLMEVNWGGALSIPQLSGGRGMLTPAYREHLARNGVTLSS